MIHILQTIAQPFAIKKGEYVFSRGEYQGALFFIEKGLLKAFYQTHQGDEWVKSFLVEGDMIGSLQAIVNQGKASFSLLCLEDCQLLKIPADQFWQLVNANPDYLKAANQLLLQLAMKKERREYELLCLSAEERYQAFCKRDAHLLHRLSQQEIAKYIGITPVALSRIRKRLGLINSKAFPN